MVERIESEPVIYTHRHCSAVYTQVESLPKCDKEKDHEGPHGATVYPEPYRVTWHKNIEGVEGL